MSFIDDLGTGTAGAVTSSVFGGLSNALFGGINARRAERAAQKQYDRQIDFWNRQNEYNTPTAQRQRLEDANLNPALMYGSGSGANTAGGLSTVPGNNVEQQGFIKPPLTAEPLDQAVKLAQIDNIRADTAKKQGDTLPPGVQSEYIQSRTSLNEQGLINAKTDNELQRFDLFLQKTLSATTIATAEQSLNNMRTTGQKIMADLVAQLNENSQFPNRVRELENNLRLQALNMGLANARIDLMRSGIEVNDAQIERISAAISLMSEQELLAGETRSSVHEDVRLKQQQFERNKPGTEHSELTYWTNYVTNITDATARFMKALK